jgi:hypothetical protein
MSADVPNAFIQTKMPDTVEGEARIMLKITGVLVDQLVQLAPETYGPFVVFEKGRKVIYAEVLRALYGMLVASLLWYKKFRADLEGVGFKFNPYDPCVANRTVDKKQHTVRFHVDDLMSSHMSPKVNDDFEIWLNLMYGNYGAVKATRGDRHDYLGMVLDFSKKGTLIVDMCDYVAEMIEESMLMLGPKDTALTPAADDLFAEGTGDPLCVTRGDLFHRISAKGLFVCKRARPDTHPTVAVLCTRVRRPIEDDWTKMVRG